MSAFFSEPDRIVERVSRGIIRALRSQFASPHEALCELIDNATNYRGASGVDVSIDITCDRLVIQNIGGRGMGRREIADFVVWGGGEIHGDGEISAYNQGGKSALSYLGNSYVLWSKRAGSLEWYRLDDPGFASRLEPRDYGLIEPLHFADVPMHLRNVPLEEGAVRIELTDLDLCRRMNPDALLRSLGDTYGKLIEQGALRLTLNGQTARSVHPVLDEDVSRAHILFEDGAIRVSGWCGKLCRASGGRQPRPGYRLYAKGRLIREGEWLGANAFAKGSLASFYGELEIVGLTPNLNKTDFCERGTHIWARICESVLEQSQPVLQELKGAGDPARITDRDRRLARQVRRELESALQSLLGSRTEEITETVITTERITSGPGDRKVVGEPGGRNIGGPGRVVERDVMTERKRIVESPALPEIRIDSWEGPTRAETRTERGIPVIYVNKSHPGFAAASAKYFIAESAILEALKVGQNQGWDIDAYCGHADEALAEWARANVDGE